LIANVKVWKVGKGNKFNAYSGYIVVFSSSKSTKEVFCLQGAWHSKNTLPTIVHGQVFCIITWHLSSVRHPHPPTGDLLSSSVGYGRHEPPQLLIFPPRIWHSSWRLISKAVLFIFYICTKLKFSFLCYIYIYTFYQIVYS
jgi:hypothetical protein